MHACKSFLSLGPNEPDCVTENWHLILLLNDSWSLGLLQVQIIRNECIQSFNNLEIYIALHKEIYSEALPVQPRWKRSLLISLQSKDV